MIKEKYIPYLAAIAMIMMLALVAIGSNIRSGSQEENAAEIKQPEYMSKIFDKDELLQIDIQIDEKNWEDLKENAAQEQYYPANLTINGETYYNVGIRAKGNSSLSMVAGDDTTDRYSFKIKVDEYQKQNIYGLEKFVLNNMIGDATYMKEYLSYDMCKEMGLATPGYSFADITLNGEPWGVYLAVESLEESFVERNFGSLEGNLYKVESMGGGGDKAGAGNPPQMPDDAQGGNNEGMNNSPQGNQPGERPDGNMQIPEGLEQENMQPQDESAQEQKNQNINKGQMKGQGGMGGMGAMGSAGGANLVYSDDEISSYSSIFNYTVFKKTKTKDYERLIGILKNLNEGTNLEECIDVEEVLRYFAVNTFLVNLDSYAGNMKHNFYLYEEEGKLQILPWDYNLAFGAFGMTEAAKVINFPIDAPVTDSMENSPLISKLLEVDTYKEMYHGYLQELIDNYMTSSKYMQTIEKLDALIGDAVKADATAFYTYDDYQKALEELKQYAQDRTASIKAQISGEQPSTTYGTVATNIDLMAMGQQNGGKGGPGGDKPNGRPGEGAAQQGGRVPQGNMPGIDMEAMQKVMGIIGDAASVSELTEDQKAQIAQLDIDDSTLENIFTMKKRFEGMGGKGMHNAASDHMAQMEISTEDKVMAAVCSVLLGAGLIFALKFRRRRY